VSCAHFAPIKIAPATWDSLSFKGDRHARAFEDREAEHRLDARLHASMIWLDQLFKYFDDRSRVSFRQGLCWGNSLTARCEAA
jgi:hypothetical protein